MGLIEKIIPQKNKPHFQQMLREALEPKEKEIAR